MKAAALRGALSDRAREGQVHVISGLVAGDTPSTKTARTILDNLTGGSAKVLVVIDRADEVSQLSVRNLPSVHVLSPDQLNTYDVLANDAVVFTADALRVFLAGRTTQEVAR
jgi:large subunit ribosomal protein L4